MMQTLVLQLAPTPEQHAALLDTLHPFNQACNYAAEIAYTTRTSNKFELQKLVYAPLRLQYHLPAQMAIRAISQTVEAYKRDKSITPTFRPEGAMVYAPRIMRFKDWEQVSLLTLSGRVLFPFRFGAYQQARLEAIRGQADLLARDDRFALAVTLEVPEPAPDEPQSPVGGDLGIGNLATVSDGQTCSGG